MFVYCNNNPVNLLDQNGKKPNNTFCVFDESKSCFPTDAIYFTVPLYDQGRYFLCWAFCQVMLESYRDAVTLSPTQATQRAVEIAQEYHGKDDWNKGILPSTIGKRVSCSSINDLYNLLVDNGPLYVSYNGKSAGHMVLVVGVNVTTGDVFTNNPQGVRGYQSFYDFSIGYAITPTQTATNKEFVGVYIPY